MREKAGRGCGGTGGSGPAQRPPPPPPGAPAYLVVPQAHVFCGLLHLLQDELLPPPLLQPPLGQQPLVRLASPFALLLLGPGLLLALLHLLLALLRFALLLLGLGTDPGTCEDSGSGSCPVLALSSLHTHLGFLLGLLCSGGSGLLLLLVLGLEGTSSATWWRLPPQSRGRPEPRAAARTFRLIFFLILLIFSLSSSLSTSASREGGWPWGPPEPGRSEPGRRGWGTLGFQPLQQPRVRLAQQIHHLELGRAASAALGGRRLLGFGLLGVAGSAALARDGLDARGDLLGAQLHPLQTLRHPLGSPSWHPLGSPPVAPTSVPHWGPLPRRPPQSGAGVAPRPTSSVSRSS